MEIKYIWYAQLFPYHNIPDVTDGLREPYDGITQMIHIALTGAADMDPDKSLLAIELV
jgi:hypothetical protein